MSSLEPIYLLPQWDQRDNNLLLFPIIPYTSPGTICNTVHTLPGTPCRNSNSDCVLRLATGPWLLWLQVPKGDRLKFARLVPWFQRGTGQPSSWATMQFGEERGWGWISVLAEFLRPSLPSWTHETGANNLGDCRDGAIIPGILASA